MAPFSMARGCCPLPRSGRFLCPSVELHGCGFPQLWTRLGITLRTVGDCGRLLWMTGDSLWTDGGGALAACHLSHHAPGGAELRGRPRGRRCPRACHPVGHLCMAT
ncbi:hypothetical protein FM106_23385 [Brachybacterium faecium]|nr:hypothetical protein FM106_23385 [Brachybacterium faecium]